MAWHIHNQRQNPMDKRQLLSRLEVWACFNEMLTKEADSPTKMLTKGSVVVVIAQHCLLSVW